MIIIHPLKIAFEDAPKVGSTSLFNWLYYLLYGKKYTPIKGDKKTQHIHGWIQAQQNKVIENTPLENFKCPEDYLVFCLVRDPVKRLLSAYSNRVLHHNELNFSHKQEQKESITLGLLAERPTLNYFVEHLEDYQAIAPTILHHTRPLVYFLGTDSSIYDYIFDISNMESLRQVLLKHWLSHDLLETQTVPKIPHLQTGGKKFSLTDLTESNFNKCLSFYADDYATFSILNKDKTIQSWHQAHVKRNPIKPKPINKVVIKVEPYTEIIETHWLSKNKLAIHKGEIESFSGAILLKSTVPDKYQLMVSDARGERQLEWNDPSPKIAEQYPDNPYALNSRFKAQGLQIDAHHPVKIFIEDDLGNRQLFFIITEENH
ncbi:MAG: sulfotransferase family 2 domain-containing protein [Methylococcaceae bacterium]